MMYAVSGFMNERSRLYASSNDEQILDDLYRFCAEVVSEEMVEQSTSGRLGLGRHVGGFNFLLGRFAKDELIEVSRRLMKVERPVARYLGRRCLVSLKMVGGGFTRDDLHHLDHLLRWHEERGSLESPAGRRVVRIRGGLVEQLKENPEPPPPKAPAKKHHTFDPPDVREYDPGPRVCFEPIEGPPAEWRDLFACGTSFDVGWSPTVVHVIGESGQVKEVFQRRQDPDDAIQHVTWDGKSLWISTRQSGIWVVSPQGDLLGRVDGDRGLPPSNLERHADACAPCLLHPIEPGRCLAIGETGRHGRNWFAFVSGNQRGSGAREYRAKIFYRARQVTHAWSGRQDADLDQIFSAAWTLEYTRPERRKDRLLLVGRRIGHKPCLPLAIDLRTLEISVFSVPLPSSLYVDSSGQGYCSMQGRILFAGPAGDSPRSTEIKLFSPPARPADRWRQRTLAALRWNGDYNLRPGLLEHKGDLYRPGTHWYHIDPENWQCERLTKDTLPKRHWYTHFAVSAHHGLVAWNDTTSRSQPLRLHAPENQLFRVQIDSPEPPRMSLLYPNVPAADRKRHHNAIVAIQKLGGRIGEMDTRWDEGVTAVILDQRWEGGDEGLRHLARVHDLRELHLAGAPVSGEGLKLIGELRGLMRLSLVETDVRDDDLKHLGGLANLRWLRLEGTLGGNELSDAGLVHLAQLSRLQHLTLWGPGFTESGLRALAKPPELHQLRLFDTRLTKSVMKSFHERYDIFCSLSP